MKDRTVGIGWVEKGEGTAVPGTREQALNFAAGLPLHCSMIRGDLTDPAISMRDFQGDGPAQRCDGLFLSGHGAGPSGGFLLPGDFALKHDTVKFGGSLRCVVIAACSMFEGDSNSGDDPKIWQNAFDGLHLLIAPRSFIGASPGRSARFAKHLSGGLSFVNAWTLACEEAGTASGFADERWAVLFPGSAEETESSFLSESLDILAPPPDVGSADFTLRDIF